MECKVSKVQSWSEKRLFKKKKKTAREGEREAGDKKMSSTKNLDELQTTVLETHLVSRGPGRVGM